MPQFRIMEWSRETPGALRPLYWLLLGLSLVPLCLVVPMAPARVGVVALVGWTALIWIVVLLAKDRFHYSVPLWIAIYPYCYHYLSFPAERSIFTVDRAMAILMVIDLLLHERKHGRAVALTRDLSVSAYCWSLYLLVCLVSLTAHPVTGILSSYRYLIDGMMMPAVFGLYAIRRFPLMLDLKQTHICVCVLGLGLFAVGLFELTTGVDLLPWAGSEPMFTTTQLRRADGPFEQQIVPTMVGILAWFFILYLRKLMGYTIPRWHSLLHKAGSVACLGAALLPLNRGLVVALIPVAIIDSYSQYRLVSRRLWIAFFTIVLSGAIAASALDPRLYEDRVSGLDNIYSRIAQHEETLRVFQDYPLFGVGMGLYESVASQNPQYMAKWNGIESMNVQHNVLMSVLTDSGIVGLLFYVAAQVFFIRGMWKIRSSYPPGWLAFLYCVLVYLLIGLDFATVYFSDINLLYMLILGIIYRQQLTMARRESQASQSFPLVPERA